MEIFSAREINGTVFTPPRSTLSQLGPQFSVVKLTVNGRGSALRPRHSRAQLYFRYSTSPPSNGAFQNQIGASVGAVSDPTAEGA